MAKGQAFVSTVKEMEPILAEAKKVFEVSKDSLAYTLALRDWHYNRQPNSKRAALERLEQNDTAIMKNELQIIAMLEQMSAILKAMEQNITDLSKK